MEIPEGFNIPIHRSLIKKLTWGGIPRNLFLANCFFGIFGAIILKSWSILILAVGIHYLIKWLTSKDPQFHEVFFQSLKHKKHYER